MANQLQPVRGTKDLIGEDAARHFHVIEIARRVTRLYGFYEWQTPIFEDTRVFSRTLGETSDVVTKEMYTFQDRGGDSITLRPEGTAGVCRALITGGLTQTLPQKVFYAGPMFRYERPQKGRYRQFHQIGVELLGAVSPLADAEVISVGWRILDELGIAQDVVLNINTLGDAQSRANYRNALVDYFSAHADKLSEDSKLRLEKNPLRILDSKDEGDKKLVENAPLIYAHLTEEAAAFYDGLKSYLTAFGVKFEENPRIVRGLDYYNHTAFEFVTNSLGAQGTVIAGGRYDGLVQQMGGPTVPGIGWGAGIERLSMLIAAPPVGVQPVAVIPMSAEFEGRSLEILNLLRNQNIAAETGYSGNAKKRLERANKSGAGFAVLVGAEIKLKNLTDGSQEDVTADMLVKRLGA
ncbi:histidine--tRNA ligase [Acidocella sp.]|uniref:histidine--tRNA ligase n=1 Tax=Acidocella sp. TaxID=50710 RepID=UPI002609BDA7|nr:histidine--tRNA ligase [Acidocella sp.]